MIGGVKFTYRQQVAVAVLDDEGRWHCARVPAIIRVLNILFDPRREDHAGADDPWGHRQVRAAADWLKGAPVLGPCRPAVMA